MFSFSHGEFLPDLFKMGKAGLAQPNVTPATCNGTSCRTSVSTTARNTQKPRLGLSSDLEQRPRQEGPVFGD